MRRRLTSLILAITMTLMSAVSIIPVGAAVSGDVDGNGTVTANDYILAKRYVLGTKTLTQSQKKAADVDGNGYVDGMDYIIIKRIVLGTLESTVDDTEEVSVSHNKSYTTNVSANADYPDTGMKELTDGYVASTASYTDASFCGYNSDVEITVNLGNSGKKISSFELSYLNINEAGVYTPSSVSVYGGNSSSSCTTLLGSKSITFDKTGSSIKTVRIELSSAVNYSYVRFVVKKSSTHSWVFIDEVIVYGLVEVDNSGKNDPYASDKLTDANRASQLASITSTKPYNVYHGRTVISGGCNYSISCASYDTRAKYNSVYLTNSQPAGAAFSGYAWVGLNMSSSATITLTLSDTALDDVCGFAVHCFNRSVASINMPSYVDISASTDGSNYYIVGRVYAADTNIENCSYSLMLDTCVNAKYVRFTFPQSAGYLWIEEIEVYANRYVSKPAGSTTGYLDASSNVLGGASDIALIYHNAGTVNEDFLLPYVAYIDENGNVLDTMFDGFLFLPAVGTMYTEGSTPYGTNKAEDWNWMFNEIFKSGYNFDALEKTAEKVKFLMGKSSMKVKVYVTIPHMDPTLSAFGDINGDGKNDSLTTLDGRVYVAKTFAERVIKEFKSKKYSNLELAGFYWFHESIDSTDGATAISVNSAFDKLGYPLFWIPFYGATGFLKGYDYGFDAVCLQPNYAFDLEASESRLSIASDYAKKYGMSLEIEIADDAVSEIRSFKRYMEYLSGGIKYGYMKNSLHMYYQGFGVIAASRDSATERGKLIYKYTYDFIKGKLNVTPKTVGAIYLNGRSNAAFGGTVNTEGTDALIYKVSSSPDHGSLAFAEDGTFVYYPNKNFEGTDSFTYQISNYLGWSKDCTVQITVG